VFGEAPGKIMLIESERDLPGLNAFRPGRLAYATQTILSVDDTRALVKNLRDQHPDVQGPQGPPTEDICYATRNQQDALRELLPDAQLVLVVGSANSSNTQRLIDLAIASGLVAKRIDGPEEIQFEWLMGVKTAVLTFRRERSRCACLEDG
jgi:4-hydroxy-3-methylbut-2-en-1-yl diphosphate reductase